MITATILKEKKKININMSIKVYNKVKTSVIKFIEALKPIS